MVVGGNCLLFVDKAGLRVFPLDRYVCRRDPMGNVIEIITKETININILPENIREVIYKTTNPEDIGDKTCDLYTCVKRTKNKFIIHFIGGVSTKKCDGCLILLYVNL